MTTGKRQGSGKSGIFFLKRQTARLMVFSMITCLFATPAHADSGDNAPRIAGNVTMAFYTTEKYGYPELRFATKMNVVFDYSGCDSQEYDPSRFMSQVSGMRLLWGERSYDLGSYEFLEAFHTALVDVGNAAWSLFIDVAAQQGIVLGSSGDITSLSGGEFQTICDALQQASLTLEVAYRNGTAIRHPVRAAFSSSEALANYDATASAVVIDLADGKTESADSLEMVRNAIGYVDGSRDYTNRYYVDVDSANDVLIPMRSLSADASLTKLMIGPKTVYRTSAAIGMPEGYETAEASGTEATQVFRYSYTDENGIEQQGISTREDPSGLTRLLKNGIFRVNEERLTLPELCAATDNYGGYSFEYDKLMENVDKLMNIVSDGVVVDSVQRFHIAFEASEGADMSGFITALQGSEDPRVRYELGQTDVYKTEAYGCDYADTKVYVKYSWNTDGVEETRLDSPGASTIGHIYWEYFGELYWVEYCAYDDTTLRFLQETAEQYGIRIDESQSTLPEFKDASTSPGTGVMEYYSIREVTDIPYGTWQDADGKTILQWKSRQVTDVTLPQEDEASSPDASYQNGRVEFPVQELAALEKGTAYNVTAQVQTNDIRYMASCDESHYDKIRYRNGDLVRTYMDPSGRLWYTEYKYGELVPASRPTICRGLTYDKDTGTLSWERPEDEGLGVSAGGARTDSCIYVKSYTVNIYDEDHDLVDSFTVSDDGNEMQRVELSFGRSRAAVTYTVEVVATNALGDSEKAVAVVEKTVSEDQNTPGDQGDPKEPDDTEDPGTPEEPDTPQGGGTPEDPDTPQGGGAPEEPDTPQGGGTPENPVMPQSPVAPVAPTITPVKPASTMSPPRMSDRTPIGLWLFLLCASGMGLEVLGVCKLKELRG